MRCNKIKTIWIDGNKDALVIIDDNDQKRILLNIDGEFQWL